MARKQIGTVSFSITGEFITDHCRERVLSGDWCGALAVLEEVEGFGMENSIKLLKGEVELYGDSSTEKGVLLRETDSTDKAILKYLKSFNFLYAGLYNFNNTVFKPEYHVKAFNAEDIETAIEIYGEDSDTSAFFRARSMHYAPNSTYLATGPVTKQDKINGDYDPKLVSKKALLWKPVADYPIWITPHKILKMLWLITINTVNCQNFKPLVQNSLNRKKPRTLRKLKAPALLLKNFTLVKIMMLKTKREKKNITL